MADKIVKEFQGQYRWLSNFVPAEVELNGVKYASVEHAYMSAKSDDPEWKAYCADGKNKPGDVKRKSKTIQLRPDWNEIKLGVMEHCVRQKFNQEPYKSRLLATGDMYLQESNTWKDTFWGIDLKTGNGFNNLGKLIMKIRKEINESQRTKGTVEHM